MPSGSSGTLLLLWVSQSHEGREGQEDGQRLPELISHGWVSYCSSMSQPSEVRGWAAVVLGPTYHSGTQLLAGDGCLLQCMVTTGRGKDGAPIREVFLISLAWQGQVSRCHTSLWPHLEAGVREVEPSWIPRRKKTWSREQITSSQESELAQRVRSRSHSDFHA